MTTTTKKNVGIIATLVMSFKTLGVIYGNIGTSPLYAFTAIFPNPPDTEDDVIGACSLIIWSLTIVPLIKYVFIVLRADDNGQGGIFALYSLLNRHSGLSIRGEQRPDDFTIVNYDTTSTYGARKNFISRHKFVQSSLLVVVLLGASLIISDGLFAPAVSVISAVEGITIQVPSLAQGTMIPTICSVIISLSVMSQRFDTNKAVFLFAPIVFLWFMTIASIGILNISFYPQIIKAFNPYYSYNYFMVNKEVGLLKVFASLSGVLLAITGVEALYADLGHFNRISIQLSFPFIVYPALILTYLGQGARLVLDNTVISNTFWNTVPKHNFIYWSTLVLAILTTFIASRAMLSATFLLVHQATQLDAFPRVKINQILMIAIAIICNVFKKSANLTVAYGVAVSSVMFITTILLSIALCVVWKLPIIVSLAFLVVFGAVDLAFLFSTLLKFLDGGWLTLWLVAHIVLVMLVWRWGVTLKFKHEQKTSFDEIFVIDNNKSLDIGRDEYESNELVLKYLSSVPQKNRQLLAESGFKVSRLPGVGIFYNGAGFGVPLTFKHYVQHFSGVPQILIFISVRPIAIPYVGEDDRLVVNRVSDYHDCYSVIARYGYMENVSQGEEFVTRMIEAIRKIDSNNENLSEYLNLEKHVTYIFGRQSIRPKQNSSFKKKSLINIYALLENISKPLYGNWEIPMDDVVDVGVKIDV